jgi:hypothetical protein
MDEQLMADSKQNTSRDLTGDNITIEHDFATKNSFDDISDINIISLKCIYIYRNVRKEGA